MKLLVTLLFVLAHVGHVFASDDKFMVQNSVGKLVLFHDSKYSYQKDLNSLGSVEVFRELLKVYDKNIKNLPIPRRVDFFWSSMWHLELDGHSMVEFQKLVMKDCGEAFMKRLQIYIDKESELKRNKLRLSLSRKVLLGMKLIQEK